MFPLRLLIYLILAAPTFFIGSPLYASQCTYRGGKLSEMILLPEQPCQLDSQLTVTVVQLVEDWMPPDRRSVMVITLRMQTTGVDEMVQITSDEPVIRWHGYRFEYFGGWRDEVRLRLIEIE